MNQVRKQDEQKLFNEVDKVNHSHSMVDRIYERFALDDKLNHCQSLYLGIFSSLIYVDTLYA